MPDIIRLLPDKIANRIAAGEVVLRPASVVKELLENAIDAGAKSIQLVVRHAGKTLVQVTDNGTGMTETDARMSFERHATSKIKDSKDLFSITTMGFRGEALASIASISKVEMKTKTADMPMGTHIIVEGSSLQSMEPCACLVGTMISVKGLFFNTPARRKFLKSDPVELRHTIEAFLHVVLAYPNVFFSLVHNDNEVYRLPISSQKERIVRALGKQWNDKLVPIKQTTDIVEFSGYIGKPEGARKRRGDQFFFVNDRFIKSGYLHHAVKMAYEGLISKEHYPAYVIFMTIDPAKVDVNVHPSKHEVKFEEERIMYNYLLAAVRHALGSAQVLPSLDFDRSATGGFESNPVRNMQIPRDVQRQQNNKQEWRELYRIPNKEESSTLPNRPSLFTNYESLNFVQHDNRYMFVSSKEGVILVDVLAARQKLIYERFNRSILMNKGISRQKELFPIQINLSTADAELMPKVIPIINRLGFELEHFGGTSYINHSTPAISNLKVNLEELIEGLLDNFKNNRPKSAEHTDFVVKSLTRGLTSNAKYSKEEMQQIFNQLIASEPPYRSPFGKKCMVVLSSEHIASMF